ncbi:DUF4126 domain-containing protein [Desulfosarcina sp.]|uniref:DUF4126 domain-containing protein n=1 Tax=Desulfosarcina sp. TaxID=2027861 RepID=UPI0029B2113A|nr:DUF4126 domain-containing protein [Desulfosarcina sp.]MDX2453710.1 DUF4126 domain-containing protein [Desulfosarcina sp.]MDX2491404.1 DUF4126 domain-containing protein [Desulfosarcina sp.]
MENVNEIARIIALTMGAAWAAGINLYAAIATLGILSVTGNMTLPPDLQVLANPLVIGAACLMFAVEFIADKMPGVDTGWDTVHTFIRIPAGALLAAGAVGELNPAVSLAAALLGGTLAAGTHGMKAGSRLLINTSPEPLTNWTASIVEDIMVIGGIWAAVHHPWVFLVLLAIFILLMIWLLPKVWRGIKLLAVKIKQLFTPRQAAPPLV